LAGFSIFLIIFKYCEQSQNERISASFTWLVTKGLLRTVDLEMMQFVDLRKCYAQTVFTFWTTLVLFMREVTNTVTSHHIIFHDLPVLYNNSLRRCSLVRATFCPVTLSLFSLFS
jgi:hypothetical protein